MAFYYEGCVILFATDECDIQLLNTVISDVEYGVFDGDGNFSSLGQVDFDGQKLCLEGGKVYKAKVNEPTDVLTSDVIENIG